MRTRGFGAWVELAKWQLSLTEGGTVSQIRSTLNQILAISYLLTAQRQTPGILI